MFLTIELELALGGDEHATLTVVDLSGVERIGAPYRFELGVTQPGTEPPLTGASVVSVAATIRMVEVSGQSQEVVRTIRGVVDAFEEVLDVASDGVFHYRFVVAPRLSELGRFSSQDLYAGLSLPEVVRAKLLAAQFAEGGEFELRLADPSLYGGDHWTDGDPDGRLTQPRMVVQYRESDLAFISRLSEHIGVSFFFEPDEQGERVVFTDHTAGFARIEEAIVYRAPTQAGSQGSSHFHGLLHLARRVNAIASDFYVYDYSYPTPAKTYDVDGQRLFDVIGGEAHLEVPSPGALVEYAPNAATADEAKMLARVRADAEEGRRERIVGSGPAPRLFAGARITIENNPRVDSSEELLVVSAKHTFVATPAAGSRHDDDKPPTYVLDFEAVVANKRGPDGRAVPYRPERTTPRPRIFGVVTGVVQSVAPNEAMLHQHIDAQGRYLVKMHFDQTTRRMPRVRMAQPHAGSGYGHHFPLRPGAEVVVAFVDGDPDRPILLGAVPNPLQQSPVVAPKDGEFVEMSRIQTRTGIKIELSDGSSS